MAIANNSTGDNPIRIFQKLPGYPIQLKTTLSGQVFGRKSETSGPKVANPFEKSLRTIQMVYLSWTQGCYRFYLGGLNF
jgi:hypothetical protein